MVQVHTLRDLEQQPMPRAAPQPTLLTDPALGPRPTFLDYLFPGFKARTFIFAISMVQIVVYILTVLQSGGLLGWMPFSLEGKGAAYGPPVVNGELWRFVTPIMLHAGFLHLLFNMFFQMRMGFLLETKYGMEQFARLYIVTGLIGNSFSLAMAPCKVSVGASTAGFGMVGLQMAEIALMWHLLVQKNAIMYNIIFFFAMALMMSIGPESLVDWRGHMGGFLAGFSLGILFCPSETPRPPWYATAKTGSLVSLMVLAFGSVLLLFLVPLQSRGCGRSPA